MGIIKKFKSMDKVRKFISLIGIVSLVLIMLGVKFSSNFFGLLSGTIGTILMTNIILEYINNNISKKDDLNEICRCLNSEINAIELGIKNIDINEERVLSIEKIIKEAKSRIDIMHIYGLSWTRSNEEYLIEALKNNKLKIRVIISDFNDNDVVNIYKKVINVDLTKKKDDIINTWSSIYKRSGENKNLEIYLFNGVITHAVHMNEDNIIIKSIPSCKAKGGLKTTTIFAEKKNNGIYYNYEKEITHIIEESKPCELK